MRHVWWFALGALALALSGSAARAQDAKYRPTPKPTSPYSVIGASMTEADPANPGPSAPAPSAPAPSTPAPAVPMAGAEPPHPGPAWSSFAGAPASCSACRGKGEGKLRRLFEWLTYRPLPGSAKCKVCEPFSCACHPPPWVYFPCLGGGCGSGGCGGRAVGAAAAATMYFAKSAGQTTNGPITQAGFVNDAQAADGKGPPAYHPSTYKPESIAKSMPVLPPSIFRKTLSKGGGCQAPQQ
jgi:hypothetical protein